MSAAGKTNSKDGETKVPEEETKVTEEKEKILAKMEEDIREKCDALDEREKNISKRESTMEAKLKKREESLDKLLVMQNDSELFTVFIDEVSKIYSLWVSNKGSDVGLIEAVQQILITRKSICKDPEV